MVDYLGSTINVVASSLGLVTVVVCVLAGAGMWIWPAVLVAYAIGAAGRYLAYCDPSTGAVLPGVAALRQDRPGLSAREAAARRLLTLSSLL